MKHFIFVIMIVSLVLVIIGLSTPGYASYPYLFTSLGLTILGWGLVKIFTVKKN
jgi:hypothetical protein